MYSAPPQNQPPALTPRRQRQFWILVTTLLAVLCLVIEGIDAWPKRHYPAVVWTFGVLATIYSLLPPAPPWRWPTDNGAWSRGCPMAG